MNKIAKNHTKYNVFKTKWGYFGLAGTENALLKTCLPMPDSDEVKSLLVKDLPAAQLDNTISKDLQAKIVAYFDGGDPVDFTFDIPLALDHFPAFTQKVLTACRRVTFGQTITYSQLAQKAGNPFAARAIGSVMAKNPLPLVIPCHRVLRSDGKLGGFSAPGGLNTKQKLLQLEHSNL